MKTSGDIHSEHERGDVVILKSGGPPMVIEREMIYIVEGKENPSEEWICVWFDDQKMKQSDHFHKDILRKY